MGLDPSVALRPGEAVGGGQRRRRPCVHARSKWSMRSLVIPCFDQRRTEAWSGGDGVAARAGVPLRVRTRTSAVLSAHSHVHAYGTLALELLARGDPFCLETPRKVKLGMGGSQRMSCGSGAWRGVWGNALVSVTGSVVTWVSCFPPPSRPLSLPSAPFRSLPPARRTKHPSRPDNKS